MGPGPGAYIDINNPQNSSVTKPMLKFSSDRTFAEAHGIKLGAFGSNAKRFEKGLFGGKDGPGPGQYEKEESASNETKDLSQIQEEADQKPAQNVFFKSTTDRFLKIDNQNPNIRILDSASNVYRKGSTQNKRDLNVSGQSTRAETVTGGGGVISYIKKGPTWTH